MSLLETETGEMIYVIDYSDQFTKSIKSHKEIELIIYGEEI